MKMLSCVLVVIVCVVSSITLEQQSKLSEESPLISHYYKTGEQITNSETKPQSVERSSTNHERNVDKTISSEKSDSIPYHVKDKLEFDTQVDTVPELQVGCEKGFIDHEKHTKHKHEKKNKVEKATKQNPVVHYSSNSMIQTLIRNKRDTKEMSPRVPRQVQGFNPTDILSQLRHHNGNTPIIYVVGTSNWCVNGPSLLVPFPYQNQVPYFPYIPQFYPQFPPQFYPQGQYPTGTQSPTNTQTTNAPVTPNTLITEDRFGPSTLPNWGAVETTTTRRPETQQVRTRRPVPSLFHNSNKDANFVDYNPPQQSLSRPERPSQGLRPQIDIGNDDSISFFDPTRQSQQTNRNQRPNTNSRFSTTVRPTTTTTTTRPPSMRNDPTRCVWAIVSCCTGSTDTISYACFENLGCRGAFWDISPCSREFALAALRQTMQFYDRN